jgi:hypothetical protein
MAFDLRAKVYSLLREDLELQDLIAKEWFQRSSFFHEEPPKTRPFGIYELGTENPSGPTALRAKTAIVQVWVHDVMGDYGLIDDILARVKIVFEAAEHEGDFLELRYLGRSPDLEDLDLKTICRYVRFSATLTR